MKIVAMWFNQSPQLTWEDVVDTLFCYGLVNTAVPLANRHGVVQMPVVGDDYTAYIQVPGTSHE